VGTKIILFNCAYGFFFDAVVFCDDVTWSMEVIGSVLTFCDSRLLCWVKSDGSLCNTTYRQRNQYTTRNRHTYIQLISTHKVNNTTIQDIIFFGTTVKTHQSTDTSKYAT